MANRQVSGIVLPGDGPDLLQFRSRFFLLSVDVYFVLKSEPVAFRRSEKPGQPESAIDVQSPLAVDYIENGGCGNSDLPGQTIRCYAVRNEVFLR